MMTFYTISITSDDRPTLPVRHGRFNIADEAGKILDGIHGEGFHVDDEVFSNTTSTEKDLWNLPFGIVYSIDPDS